MCCCMQTCEGNASLKRHILLLRCPVLHSLAFSLLADRVATTLLGPHLLDFVNWRCKTREFLTAANDIQFVASYLCGLSLIRDAVYSTVVLCLTFIFLVKCCIT